MKERHKLLSVKMTVKGIRTQWRNQEFSMVGEYGGRLGGEGSGDWGSGGKALVRFAQQPEAKAGALRGGPEST